MAARYRRPAHRRMLTLTVRGRERVSPHFMSVTLGGDDFRHLERSGYDQAGRLFFPGPGQDGFVIDPELLARYLMAVGNGIAVQAASGVDRETLQHVADLALRTWPVST